MVTYAEYLAMENERLKEEIELADRYCELMKARIDKLEMDLATMTFERDEARICFREEHRNVD